MTDKTFIFRDGLLAFQECCLKCGIEYKILIHDGRVKGEITSKNFKGKKLEGLNNDHKR